ncbi:class I SAM-dependent methyltransferase [Salinivibrio costicola]|uniref:Class I SAM-dependent methyltransferase n=1 Tax=Salinivibrio costicola TaxID=51367 RepID=A0ABX6K8B0_SALCS|nr:class I SAM-dependent methyltransferase [Salinivibrio costicola]QIR06511.1 class I SAM-dependent methyltransferase [Salinivibrio costicola]
MTKDLEKFKIQDQQYLFPYHYIPHFDSKGNVTLARKLNWGLDYLCYQMHLREKVTALAPSSVLEVGCGDGYFLGGLPSIIKKKVGIDLSERAISFAKAFHPKCDFRVQDVADMVEEYELVAAIEVIEHIPEDILPNFFNSLANRMTSNGVALLSVPTVVLPLNKKHYRHYTLDLLKNQLNEANCNLEVESYEYIYRKPWWFDIFKKLFDNRLFSFEFKPFMRFAWDKIWNNYRFATKDNGYHLVTILKKKS